MKPSGIRFLGNLWIGSGYYAWVLTMIMFTATEAEFSTQTTCCLSV